jgi:hypothetical protein
MPTMEEEFADLKRQVAELKAEQARLRGEPHKPFSDKPWPKYDPTEGMSMPPSAIAAMVAVVGERRDVIKDAPINDASRASPSPSPPPWQPQPERPRGTGWADFVPLQSPPGVALCDAMMDAQDRKDRAALIAAERAHQQAILDAHAEQKLFEKERARQETDPDFPASS